MAKQETESAVSGSKFIYPLDGATVTVSLPLAVGQIKYNHTVNFPETRFDVFHAWMVKSRLPSEAQCRLWEETVPHRREAAKLAMFLAFKQGREEKKVQSITLKYAEV